MAALGCSWPGGSSGADGREAPVCSSGVGDSWVTAAALETLELPAAILEGSCDAGRLMSPWGCLGCVRGWAVRG